MQPCHFPPRSTGSEKCAEVHSCYLVGSSCSEIISFIISTFSELEAFTLPRSKSHKVVVKNALVDIKQPLLDTLNMSKQTQMVL